MALFRRHWKPRDQRGFTLVELMIVVAVVGILASIALMMYVSLEARARIARAQADLRSIASAVAIYAAHTGVLPPDGTLGWLSVTVTNAQSQTAGPLMGRIPSPPTGWAASYTYASNASGLFTVSASGDNTTVIYP